MTEQNGYLCISQDVNEDDLNAAERFIHGQFNLCIPAFHFHPVLYTDKANNADIKEIRKIISQQVTQVYGETTLNFSRITEKDLNSEIINGVALAETVREISCLCPWFVFTTEQPVTFRGNTISAIILYFGKKDSWDYHDVRRLITEKLRNEEKNVTDNVFTSYSSLMKWLNK